MHKLIIIAFSIMLGVIIWNLIIGDDPDTLKTASGTMMQQLVDDQKAVP